MSLPEVTAWEHLGSNTWAVGGSFPAWESLDFSPSFLEDGDWEVVLPHDSDAEVLLRPLTLVTIDWRGSTTTWCCTAEPGRDADGRRVLTASGGGALSLLGQCAAWPRPGEAADHQFDADPRPQLYSGDAETVVRGLVSDNWVDRAGRELALGTNSSLGAASRARPKFSNLKEIVVRKARAGGIGVDVGLLRTSSTRAQLRLRVWEPADKSLDVRLSESAGTLGEWSARVTPPALTHAIVSGTEGTYALVTTPESLADAALWGPREGLVSGPESYDVDDLVQAGKEALADGRSRVDMALTALDGPGLEAMRDYVPGDVVTGVPDTGLERVDSISSVRVSFGPDGAADVVPTFGDPSLGDPYASMGQLVRSQDRRLRAQEQRG